MKQNENDQNHKKESTPVVDNKPNGKSQVKRQVTHKFDSFLPRTDSERADVRRYEALKASLHSLPDFYFRDISLKLQPGSTSAGQIHVADDKVRNECTRVQEKIEKLLSKYDDA